MTQLVPIDDTAWANGTSNDSASKVFNGKSTLPLVCSRGVNANLYTISIEHEGILSVDHGMLAEAQLKSTIELIRLIRSEVKRIYEISIPIDREHIVGHYQIAPIAKPNCPGPAFPWDTIVKTLKNDEVVHPNIEDVTAFCDAEGLIGRSTPGNTLVTYDTLRWFAYKLLHKEEA